MLFSKGHLKKDTKILMVVQRVRNILSVEVGQLNWFYKDILSQILDYHACCYKKNLILNSNKIY